MPRSTTLSIQRKEGFYAYQLAVVCDDIDQGITHVVRGSDLLTATPGQLLLYRAFGVMPPHFLHMPVIVNPQGQKLSKQTHAPALQDECAAINLFRALQALQQKPPMDLINAPVSEILAWGCAHWQRAALPRSQNMPWQLPD